MVLEFPEQEGPIRIEKLHVAPFSSRLVSESHLQATRSLVLSPSAHMARCLLVSLEEVEAGLGQSVVAVTLCFGLWPSEAKPRQRGGLG